VACFAAVPARFLPGGTAAAAVAVVGVMRAITLEVAPLAADVASLVGVTAAAGVEQMLNTGGGLNRGAVTLEVAHIAAHVAGLATAADAAAAAAAAGVQGAVTLEVAPLAADVAGLVSVPPVGFPVAGMGARLLSHGLDISPQRSLSAHLRGFSVTVDVRAVRAFGPPDGEGAWKAQLVITM
jgi:hypothetical protein